ncbi:MAG: prenyltransferase/squalene oxidase repeat-containing protein [Solirubrobacterales bacterium]
MSWELASFLVIGAVLAAGFGWYERSRPPAQVVALVAALAALAIAGRVAFAAFPNVKPTTDIVVFAGYALGGAPGFAVGALAALVSNFWFGQGPWTPWQMVGWGLCGVLGAALALGGRNLSRLTLAAACGFAGIAYGALLNFSLMATYGGDLSWERFWLLEGRAVPFDAAHAIGNVALALVAGPAMVRMLGRFRERFEWSRRPAAAPAAAPAGPLPPGLRAGGIAVLVLASLLLGALAPSHSHAAGGVAGAAAWMRSAQNDDGGWGDAPGEGSSPTTTAWAALGMAAAGENPLDVAKRGKTPVDYLRQTIDQQKSPGSIARTILAVESASLDPHDFGGRNLVADLLAKRRDDGSYEGWPGSTAFAVIALREAGAGKSLDGSLDWLRQVQNDDGGWGDVPGSASTADGSGAVIQALSPGSKASHRGLAYLRESQRPGGGFPLGAGGPVNSQSSAWAIEGILAAGGDPASYRRGGASALDYLAARQASDGHYRYSQSSDQTPVWVTAYVLVAMSNSHYPVSPPPREPKPAPTPTPTSPSGVGDPATLAPLEAVPPPAPAPGSTGGVSSSGAGSSGAGAPPERFASPGQVAPGAPAEPGPPEGEPSEGSGGAEAVPLASTPSTDLEPDDDPDSSPAGAIVAGLLAGCLLFGLVLLGRRGWMRWRYGL